MSELDRILNEASIAEQRRTHVLRGPLLAAMLRHRMWMWAERLIGRRRPG